MDAKLINPFVESATNVLKTMAQTEVVAGKPAIKNGNLAWGAVTGIIGMAGDDTTGNMVISFDEPSILSIVSKMLMEEFTALNKDVVDAVGEITNMITGGTKNLLSQQGYTINMATPLVMVGKNIELTQLAMTPVISIPFSTPAGSFVIEANLAKRG